jgi:2-polyprenyl-3-methyl-5-hydroxy-6-metoxy-1,4-benzoquinol methylase
VIGNLDKSTFDPEKNYDEFYAGHKFEPMIEELSYVADEVVPRVAWAVDVAKDIGAKSVLDLCCLDGFAALTLANRLRITATGIDLSAPGIKLAQERGQARNLPTGFHTMAVEDFVPGPTYDLVLLFEAIEHFTDVDKVMAVIKKSLNPGGTLLVSTPDAESKYGMGNDDPCHLRVYTHQESPPFPFPLNAPKPIISLPNYLRNEGFEVKQNEVWNGLCHVRAVLQ